MNLLIGSLTIGLILSLLALGIYLSFRIFDFPDITVDGSVTLGAATAAILIATGMNPVVASVIAMLAGGLAGMTTGILHTRFGINNLLSGILVMTALYSINLHIMGRSNIPLMNETTLNSYCENWGSSIFGGPSVNIAGWNVSTADLTVLLFVLAFIILAGYLLFAFFKTNLGTAMRATGDNPQMIRALGTNTGNMIVLGLTISNALVALAGAFLAQYQGFADIQMGIGMVVWGLASVIIGEALVKKNTVAMTICGAVMGSVLFRLLVAIALRFGLNPNDLKLITAIFVFIALILPKFVRNMKKRSA